MRAFALLPVVLLLTACGKKADAPAPAIVGKLSVLKGLTPGKTIEGMGTDILRYEVKSPYETVVAAVRKDAASGGWKEHSVEGYPVFVASTAESISNVTVQPGKLSADGLTSVPDAGTTVVGVSEVPLTGPAP